MNLFALLLLFELLELLVEALLAHLDPDDLHHLEEVGLVVQRCIFVDGDLFELLIDECLDAEKQLGIVLANKCERLAASARSGRPTDPVNIVFGVLWDIIVHHKLDGRNIEAT